jgi:ABC-type multidrug transport system fused ATPase/permease subunit
LLYRLQPHIRQFEANRITLASMGPTLEAVNDVLSSLDASTVRGRTERFKGFNDEIRFDKVSFSYPGAAAPSIVSASFSIPKGSRTAICGASGAGKTTVINLLLGLYTPSEGAVRIDGRSIQDIECRDWLANTAIAGQDVELFEASIRENILIARPDAHDADLAWSARLAGIHEFITRLPGGYSTGIGERGLNLSGGQRQRIALARAFLRKPALLILDEATNAIDIPLEANIHQNVLAMMESGTAIYITHRLADVAGIDHVIELNAGRVVYAGPPHADGRREKVSLGAVLS